MIKVCKLTDGYTDFYSQVREGSYITQVYRTLDVLHQEEHHLAYLPH